jgi:hypothetical protein
MSGLYHNTSAPARWWLILVFSFSFSLSYTYQISRKKKKKKVKRGEKNFLIVNCKMGGPAFNEGPTISTLQALLKF